MGKHEKLKTCFIYIMDKFYVCFIGLQIKYKHNRKCQRFVESEDIKGDHERFSDTPFVLSIRVKYTLN